MTKTKTTSPPRIIVSEEDLFLYGLATSATEESSAEFFENRIRPLIRKLLVSRGVNPDRMLAERKAANRN